MRVFKTCDEREWKKKRRKEEKNKKTKKKGSSYSQRLKRRLKASTTLIKRKVVSGELRTTMQREKMQIIEFSPPCKSLSANRQITNE
jgi:hypothetical protein